MKDRDSGRGCAYVGTGTLWEISLRSVQLCYKTKIALKKKTVYCKNKKELKKQVSVKVSLCYADLISFGYIPRSRITESYDSSV
jgi:hypothetical protein